MRIGLNLQYLLVPSKRSRTERNIVTKSQVKVNSNKRKKIGGNVITEGEVHDYLIEKEHARLNKIEEKRKQNDESASVTIEHNGLSIVILDNCTRRKTSSSEH